MQRFGYNAWPAGKEDRAGPDRSTDDTQRTGEMKPGSRSKLAAKLAVAVVLLGWLVSEIGTERIVRSLSGADPLLVAVAFLLICADNALRGWNWRLLLGAHGPAPRFADVLYAFLVGGFFGSFVPSSLGPDAARTVGLARRTEMPMARAASSVVMLNLVGLWALSVMFLAGGVALLSAGAVPSGLWGAAALSGAGVVLLPALLATRTPLPDLEPSSAVGKRLERFVGALDAYRSAGRPLWAAFGIALVNQAAAVLVVYTVFRAGGVDVPLAHFMAIVPIVHVARLVPATVAGFGAEQGVVVGLFALVGVEPAAALAMSVLVSGLNLGVQALSGLLYVGVSARSLGRTLREEDGGPRRSDGDAPPPSGEAALPLEDEPGGDPPGSASA